ncbi:MULTISPECIES: aromatic ring-hydroxylating dioxygenase subunit alpha [unclassified Novosphingobium]|uniref:Rieske 2Fe-2S domain-containing protein n=1 Tax=unclassified Novosphingobium TaxID=2644732 RepID=UPI00146F57A2|nr:vanillate O-demethylase monooxygenase subunit [Novosphingobium sp. SG919]NMN88269.1 vanillate O-demethylase monooxygenase subunit [Novosphingobium sp. SG916]
MDDLYRNNAELSLFMPGLHRHSGARKKQERFVYPLNAGAPWPVNQWYVAGFSSEISETPMARFYLGRRVVVFRDDQGEVHALAGLCPHRMMPMELGTLKDGKIVCGYHGLAFDLQGKCVAAPTAVSVPNCALDAFLVREAAPLVWIWMGDAALGQRTPLPPQQACLIGSEGCLTQCVDYTLLKSRYMLLIDNLFDLSHLGFIHASIVGEGGIALIKPDVEEREGRLIVSRTECDTTPDDFQRFLFPDIAERVTVGIGTDLIGISLINAGSFTRSGPSADSALLGQVNFIHCLTPETETTTHYWIMLTRDFRLDDEILSSALAAQNKAVVAQDKAALEAIEEAFASGTPLPREISMSSDLGAMRARLRITQMIRNDASALAPP